MKYVASKNQKELMADLKPVHRMPTKKAAKLALDELEAKWEDLYPLVISLV
jgi:transposase-like protein